MQPVQRDYEFEYYGLLHILKDLAFELRQIRDSLVDTVVIDRYIDLIDHEVAKTKEAV